MKIQICCLDRLSMYRDFRQSWPEFLAVVAISAFLSSMSPLRAQELVEIAPVLRASEILPIDLLSGVDHQTAEAVYNDGAINRYEVRTTYGPLTVRGTGLLRARVNELLALRRMERLKRSSTFGNAFANALKAPVQGVKALVTRPLDTVTGAVKGVGKFFSNVGHSIFGGPSEHEEGTFKRLVGLDVAKRKFAFKFGVDPYSAYRPLQERLNEIAWAAVAGGLTIKAAFSAIPGPAGNVVTGTGAARNLNKLVSDKTPAELKSLNSGKLARMGVHESLADVFLEHPKLSPTRKTMIVGALSTMPGVENRGIFIQQSVLVQTEFAAFLRQRQAGMMAGYHNNVAAVARLIKFGRAPFLQRRDGVIIGLFPVDHIAWTAGIARDTGGVIDAIAKRSDVTGGELWFEGTVSQFARRSFEAQNWVVRENVSPRLKSK